MKNILALIVLFCAVAFGQEWNTTVTNVINEPNLDKMDNFTNSSGIHILLRRSNGNIVYYRLNSSGSIDINAITLESNGDFPAITGSNDRIYAFYRVSGYIKGKYSTNKGNSWIPLINNITTSLNGCNGIDAVYGADYEYGNGVHLTYSILDSDPYYETYYRLLTDELQWVNYKNVTDYGSEIGGRPSIALSDNRVHVSYNTSASLFEVGGVKTRDKIGNFWQTPITAVSYPTHNATSEKLIVRGNYLWLIYMENVGAEFILRYKEKTIISTNWPLFYSPISSLVIPPFNLCKTNNDDLQVIYYDGNSASLSYRSYDGSWSSPTILDDNPGTQNYAISSVSNDLYTLWPHSDDYLWFKQYDAKPLPPTNLRISQSEEHHPLLTWNANNEPDIDHYIVEKYVTSETDWFQLAQTDYTHKEDTYETYCQPGEYCPQHYISYRIVAVDNGNNNTAYESDPSDPATTSVSGAPPEKSVPEKQAVLKKPEYILEQNYPNPFNPATSIYYSLRKNGWVTLKVYNMLGQEVAELVNETQSEGYHSVEFNAVDLPSGIYIYQIKSEEFSSIKKMILIK